jgi:hypothetical protein
VAGPTADSPQEVFGVITSWDANSQSIGFNSRLTKKAEQILVKSIQWDLPEIRPVAQKAPPSYQSLGKLSLTFRAEDLTVVDGVLRFPGCARKHDGKLLAFEGTVSFGGKEALLKGKVFEIHPSQGGGSSTGRKGG